jgi:6-phosphogluconolactonase
MAKRTFVAVAGFALMVLVLAEFSSAQAAEYLMYFGTYTNGASKGIYGYRFQPSSGNLIPLGLVAASQNPSFLAAHPNGRWVYAVNEQQSGTVSAFSVDRQTGKLTLLNTVDSRGSSPCHLSFDRTGRFLLVANYGTGSSVTLPIQADGRLGQVVGFVQHHGSSINPERQKGPHAHYISVSPDNKVALTADLGLDQVLEYRFDAAKGTLTPNNPPFASLKPGSGPRHLVFHPNGKYVYVNGEMSSTLSSFSYDASTGAMKEMQTVSTLPAGFSQTTSTAEIQIDRAGRFVYVSNRGHDSIAIFSVDAAKGTVTPAGFASTNGKTPRAFTLDPTGSYLFAGNQNSDSVVVFKVDPKTGQLAAAKTLTDIPQPVSMVFVERTN